MATELIQNVTELGRPARKAVAAHPLFLFFLFLALFFLVFILVLVFTLGFLWSLAFAPLLVATLVLAGVLVGVLVFVVGSGAAAIFGRFFPGSGSSGPFMTVRAGLPAEVGRSGVEICRGVAVRQGMSLRVKDIGGTGLCASAVSNPVVAELPAGRSAPAASRVLPCCRQVADQPRTSR